MVVTISDLRKALERATNQLKDDRPAHAFGTISLLVAEVYKYNSEWGDYIPVDFILEKQDREYSV